MSTPEQDVFSRSVRVAPASQCLPECRHCHVLGCESADEGSLVESIRSKIFRARRADCGEIVFTPSFFNVSEPVQLLQTTRDLKMTPVIELPLSALDDEMIRIARSWSRFGITLCLIWAGDNDLPCRELALLDAEGIPWELTLLVRSESTPAKRLERLTTAQRKRIHFLVLPFDPLDSSSVTMKQAYQLLGSLCRKFPEIRLRTAKGRDPWDHQIPPELLLEPEFAPTFECGIEGSRPAISIIIPAYNARSLIRNTLFHLLNQAIARTAYELIVVDDGSTDGTSIAARNFIAPEAGNLNFKLIHFPRKSARTMGDRRFRAGLARNLGFKHSKGEVIVFLDADIIVPPDFLARRLQLHSTHDVIQSPRFHLRRDLSQLAIQFTDIDHRRDSYILERNYWKPFFETRNWEKIPYFWKYTCTYALSIQRHWFRKVGWFHRTYLQYGFEDTDLGYRLAKSGARFHLDERPTYHLATDRERVEDGNSTIQRRKLLSNTAKVFYRYYLDPEIFEHFNSFMLNESRNARLPRQWIRSLRDRFLPASEARS